MITLNNIKLVVMCPINNAIKYSLTHDEELHIFYGDNFINLKQTTQRQYLTGSRDIA